MALRYERVPLLSILLYQITKRMSSMFSFTRYSRRLVSRDTPQGQRAAAVFIKEKWFPSRGHYNAK